MFLGGEGLGEIAEERQDVGTEFWIYRRRITIGKLADELGVSFVRQAIFTGAGWLAGIEIVIGQRQATVSGIGEQFSILGQRAIETRWLSSSPGWQGGPCAAAVDSLSHSQTVNPIDFKECTLW